MKWWCQYSDATHNTAVTLLLLLLYLPQSTPVSPIGVKDVCQGTSNGLSFASDQHENRIAALNNRYNGCKYVDGNLEITGLDHPVFYDADLSFLNSIREVTGYVLIANVYVRNVTLDNLVLIRGGSLYYPPGVSHGNQSTTSTTERLTNRKGYALFVSYNYMVQSDTVGMRLLGMKHLAEISVGHVLFENNNLLCYATTDIYWPDILSDGTGQSVAFKNDIISFSKQPCFPACHEQCQVSGVPGMPAGHYCWGPGPKNCQKLNKVTCAAQCDGDRCFGNQSNQCCHARCAGGCTGPSKNDCWGCKEFYNDGACEPFCPLLSIYDNANFQWIPNPDRKFAYGKLCVQECPRGFLQHKGGCVVSCPEGFDSKDDVECIECTGPCSKKCSLDWPAGKDFLNEENIDALEGCTILDGHLRILDITFKGDPHNRIPPLTLSKLNMLKSVKEITEYLKVQNIPTASITSLDFLSNLEKILGVKADMYNAALNIMNNRHLEYLGLTSIKSIAAGLVIIRNNPKLCYLSSLKGKRIKSGLTFSEDYVTFNADEGSYCEPQGKVCHTECKNGCWGPGNTQCVKCRNVRHGNHCLSDCNSELLFDVPGKRECDSCHPQCKSDCTGPGNDKCDACLVYSDGPYCVDECPVDLEEHIFKYPDANGTCQVCHPNCVQGCTGPGNFVGRGGCTSCQVSVANDDETAIVECLDKGAACPRGYFANTNPKGNLSFLREFVVCTKCHPLCAKCEGKGNFNCRECVSYRNGNMCVEECEPGFYTDESKECLRCHPTCRHECTGPTEWDCEKCLYYKVYNSSRLHTAVYYNSSTFSSLSTLLLSPNLSSPSAQQPNKESQPFYCTETNDCPESQPNISQEKLDTVCTYDSSEPGGVSVKDTSASWQGIIGGVAGGSAVLFVIVAIAALHCMRRARRQMQKRKWTQLMAGGASLEPVDPSSAAPDMSTLRLIKEFELRKGGILGYGAFGTVYKGVWLPRGENIKIPVAIKVLQEGNSSHQNKELLEEARVMASIDHPCCVRIVAVCMTEQMMLITQLMPLGSLLDYVRNNKQRISSKVMLNWCTQIAKGMMYLESKGVVHRDLAARNVLVRTPNQIKITDFGLAKLLDYNEGEYHSAGGKMPIKWLALESIQHRKFTHKSDVWSYGVTLWEMFTYGQKPYEFNRAREVPELLEKGERLPQPTICTIDVYMIMIKCWVINADSRPCFGELFDEFAKMSRDPGRYLVIPGDCHMRLPSSSNDGREMLATSTSEFCEEGPERMMEADDYLNTTHTSVVGTEEVTISETSPDVVLYSNGSLALSHNRGNQLNDRGNHLLLSSTHNMTYPRQNGANDRPMYINELSSHEGCSTSASKGSLANTEHKHIGDLHDASLASLKPFMSPSDSNLLSIQQLSQDRADPPDYHVCHRPSLSYVYDNGYLQPLCQAVYNDDCPIPAHDAPPTPTVQAPASQAPALPSPAVQAPAVIAQAFNFNLLDEPGKQHMFANPEYFDSQLHTNDDDEDEEITDALLPQQNKEYYSGTAAFGSDSSARDSFIST